MRKFLQEFKEFAMRGNVMDLAVGVIIGAAFQTIINSLVNDIIMPLIGLIGKVDFSQKVFVLRGVDIRYGAFLTAILNFVIMAFAIFLLVKAMNALSNLGRKKDEPEVPTFWKNRKTQNKFLDKKTTLCSVLPQSVVLFYFVFFTMIESASSPSASIDIIEPSSTSSREISVFSPPSSL